ncbi:MAG: SurA N-terminal domain-containing protein [Desulfonatronovibrionaceae bacterium]
MKRIIFTLLLIFFSLHMAGADTLVNRIVALVNGKTVTLLDLDARLKYIMGVLENSDVSDMPPESLELARRQVLDQMVNDILIMEQAERFQINVSQADLEKHVQKVREENNMSAREFQDYLQSQGLTMEKYKSQIKDSILRQRVLNMMVRRKVVVTREEIESFYQENSHEFTRDREVHLRVILVPDQETARAIRDRIIGQEMDFETAARKFSKGPNSSEGGDLGMIKWDQLAPEWKNALQDVRQGNMTDAFTVNGSVALIKLEKDNSAGTVPLEQVEDKIRERVFDDKLDQRLEEYIKGLREKAVIDIRL